MRSAASRSPRRDDNFRFFNPFNQGVMKNIAEFFHLSTDWYYSYSLLNCRMRTHYYCLMDIPNHPLREVRHPAVPPQRSHHAPVHLRVCLFCEIVLCLTNTPSYSSLSVSSIIRLSTLFIKD